MTEIGKWTLVDDHTLEIEMADAEFEVRKRDRDQENELYRAPGDAGKAKRIDNKPVERTQRFKVVISSTSNPY